MGSCVSVHKNPESAMRLKLSFGSKTQKLVIPSPVHDKPISNDDRTIADVALKSQWSPPRSVTTFRDLGSKEETFFDSQAWLESDCDDDFVSVNGDFTPSRGSTPVHQSFSMGTSIVSRAAFGDKTPGSKPEPSPTDKKKKLVELFKESLRSDQDPDEQNSSDNNKNGVNGKTEAKGTNIDLPQKSASGTPYLSGATSVCSSEGIPNGELKSEEKSVKSAQCCLPGLLSNRSFIERKKKTSPAAETLGDKEHQNQKV